jgi:hypothetical protein
VIITASGISSSLKHLLGVKASNITITNIGGNFGKVTFDAQADGKLYPCYYTSAVAVPSGALCHAKGETSPPDHCNALQKPLESVTSVVAHEPRVKKTALFCGVY